MSLSLKKVQEKTEATESKASTRILREIKENVSLQEEKAPSPTAENSPQAPIRPWQHQSKGPQNLFADPKSLLRAKSQFTEAYQQLRKTFTPVLFRTSKNTRDWLNQIELSPIVKIPVPKIFTSYSDDDGNSDDDQNSDDSNA